MKKKLVSILLVSALAASALTGCGGGSGESQQTQTTDSSSGETSDTEGDTAGTESTEGSGEIKEFTAFFAVPGTEINDDNEIQQIIAEKTGAKCKETWLTGQSDSEAVGTLIASGEYPDALSAFTGAAAHQHGAEDRSYDDLFKKNDWLSVVRDAMQTQFEANNLEGYLQYKRFWDFLEK